MTEQGGREPTVVKFARPLSTDDRQDLRIKYGLQLDQYLGDRSYLERTPSLARGPLSRDARVVSCRPQRPTSKIAPLQAFGISDNAGDEVSIEPAQLFRATLIGDADTATVGRALEDLQASRIHILDDRAEGGRLRITFAVPQVAVLALVAALPDVAHLEPISSPKSDAGPNEATLNGTPTHPSDITAMWARGLHGEAQVIGVLDDGAPDLNHFFFSDVPPNTPGAAHRKVLAVRNTAGSAVGRHATFVAACAAGDSQSAPGADPHRGLAWAARLVCGTHHDLGESSSLFSQLTQAMKAGASIHTNSWHLDTGTVARYTEDSADVDRFAFLNEDNLILGSAGNRGEEQGPPGTAKNAMCVAAATANATAEFGEGNAGPTEDGRKKPEVLAVGCDVRSAIAGTSETIERFSTFVRCATSFATPRAAAAAALARQYFMEGWHPTGRPHSEHAMVPSGALLKATLLTSTVPLSRDDKRPSDLAGWGLLRLDRILAFEDSSHVLLVWDFRHTEGLSTGDVRRHPIHVTVGMNELRATLVWTDPPPASAPLRETLVNRLSLRLLSPSHSVECDETLDPLRWTVVSNPEPGDWELEVVAREVNVGAPHQGYALVVAIN